MLFYSDQDAVFVGALSLRHALAAMTSTLHQGLQLFPGEALEVFVLTSER